MSAPKHTPGPWEVGTTGLGVYASEVEAGDDTPFRARSELARLSFDNPANAARIVACVNACEGIADPSVVPEMKALLNRAATLLMASENDTPEIAVYIAIEELLGRAEGRES